MSDVLEQAVVDYQQRTIAADQAFTATEACTTLNESFPALVCSPSDLIRDDSRHDGVRRWAYRLNSLLEDGGELLVDKEGGVEYRCPRFLLQGYFSSNGGAAPARLSGSLDPIVRYLLVAQESLKQSLRFSRQNVLFWSIVLLLSVAGAVLINQAFFVCVIIAGVALPCSLLASYIQGRKLRRLQPLSAFRPVGD